MKRKNCWIAVMLITAHRPSRCARRRPPRRPPGRPAESMLEQVMKRGVLRVGMSTFVPWAMQDKAGNFVGFEIDVANRLAQDMGVKAEFIPTKWSGIIPALLTGKFDIIIGGMGIRPERNLKVNFSIPYDHTGMSHRRPQEDGRRLQETRRFQQRQRLHRRPDGDDRGRGRQAVDAEGQTAALRRRVPGDPGAPARAGSTPSSPRRRSPPSRRSPTRTGSSCRSRRTSPGSRSASPSGRATPTA